MNKLEDRFLKEYDLYADAVFRFCYFKLSNREDAKDITQETFTKVWSYMANGGEIRNSKAFLFQTARNLVIDKYRKKKTESLDNLAEKGFDPVFEEEVSSEERLDAMQATKLLDELSDEYKEVIILRYMDELSVAEIALALDEPPGNISVRLHRAIAKLKQIYNSKDQSQQRI